jgi:xanthosine utilization system XapX-like protein
MTNPSPIESRLATIEQDLAALAADIASLRVELQAVRNGVHRGPAVPPRPASSAPRSGRRIPNPTAGLSSQELERLLGRYGMLGIAVMAAVAAVGTFLSWAVSHGYLSLGPGARVLAGLAFAGGIAVWGLRLRRTERSFGSSMLGLALVIVQVCAYAAGPSFHLVPTTAAFAGATVVSWALAMFAHRERDEPLWCVGFGGASLAPFVTSDGHGSVYALSLYGAVVLLTACFALSHREWPVAWRVFYAAAAVFVLGAASVARATGALAVLAVFALPFVVGIAGVLPFAPVSRKRAVLRWLAGLAALATAIAHPITTSDRWIFTIAFIAAMILWLIVIDRLAGVRQSSVFAANRERPTFLDWIDGAAIPLAFSLQAVEALGLAASPIYIWGAVTLISGAFAWRRAVGSLRDAAAFASSVLAVGAIAALPLEIPAGRVVALVGLGVALIGMHVARPSRSWLGVGGALMVFAASHSLETMMDRRAYQFPPFATEPSLTALIVTIGLVIVARFWRALRVATRASMGPRPEWSYAGAIKLLVRVSTLAPWLWVFMWVLVELAMAYSPSTSTLLLVTYFAATAVGCVAAGRARRAARLRQAGLALGLVAAGTAVYGASTYFDFAARIVAYLVTSAFLLGIAYWYRRPGASPATAS